MSDIVRVTKDGQLYAMFCSKEIAVDDIAFLTEDDCNFQIGVVNRKKGHVVEPHAHKVFTREISGTAEFLIVQSGKIRATVFDDDWQELAQQDLSAGDFLLFLRGGHSVEWVEDGKVVEVKQGPYMADSNEKTFLNAQS